MFEIVVKTSLGWWRLLGDRIRIESGYTPVVQLYGFVSA